jgi:hypothetical protein
MKFPTQRIILIDEGDEVTRTVHADLDRVYLQKKGNKATRIYYKTDKTVKGRVLFERG